MISASFQSISSLLIVWNISSIYKKQLDLAFFHNWKLFGNFYCNLLYAEPGMDRRGPIDTPFLCTFANLFRHTEWLPLEAWFHNTRLLRYPHFLLATLIEVSKPLPILKWDAFDFCDLRELSHGEARIKHNGYKSLFPCTGICMMAKENYNKKNW